MGTVFAIAQGLHRRFVGGIAGQVEAAQPFDRHNLPPLQQRGDRIGLVHGGKIQKRYMAPVGSFNPHPRPAGRTGDRLGMEAAIARIVIILGTGWAQGKPSHAGLGAIVGQTANHTQPRAAMGTVHKRIAVEAAHGIEQIPLTGRTNRRIGRNLGVDFAGLAVIDPKGVPITQITVGFDRQGRSLHRVNSGQGRALGLDLGHKRTNLRLGARHPNHHPAPAIKNHAPQLQFLGNPIHRGPEPNPLHNAPHLNLLGIGWLGSGLPRIV